MPRKSISAEQLAIAHALAAAHYTQHDIAKILGLDRSGLAYNLAGNRKSDMPSMLDDDLLSALTAALCHARIAGRRAVADTLRRAADELDLAVSPAPAITKK